MADYLVLNRFDDEFGEYHRFVADQDCRLAYVTLAEGLGVLDVDHAMDTVVVGDLGFETVLPVARRLTDRHGPFDAIVGLSEYDLLTAARLRAELGVPGWTTAFVSAFRDKPLMKEIVGAAGLQVPRFMELTPDVTPRDVLARLGLPVIVKPRAGAASIGVVRADSLAELTAAMDAAGAGGYECEEYVDGQIYHVDGVRREGMFHFVSASAYLNTCLDFARGAPLGSILLDQGPLRDEMVAFAGACLDALWLDDGSFHLELFRTGAGELVFLEVGLRPGGAEVAFVHRDLFGIDLFGEAFRATVGLAPMTPSSRFARAEGGGWVIVPDPRPLPSRVVSRTPMVGVVDAVYAEVLPAVGTVLDGTGGYDHCGGRFRLSGPGEDAVRRDALAVMAGYRLVAEPAVPAVAAWEPGRSA